MQTLPKILTSLLVTGVVASSALLISNAFFSDTETSTANTFQAGELDLKIDNTSYYNGVLNTGTTWTELSDLPGHLFFNFNDVKPGDWGEDTISLHTANDAWVCMSINITQNDDNTCTEPEKADDPNCIEPEPDDDLFDGNLDGLVKFLFWADDGDNVLETDENIFKKYPGDGVQLDGTIWTLADSGSSIWPASGPMPGGTILYIGKAWCLGNRFAPSPLPQDNLGPDSPRTPANSTGGITCDGSDLNNSSQTDILKLDVEFTAIQSRNNEKFLCNSEATLVDTITIPANQSTPTSSNISLTSGVNYKLEASGVWTNSLNLADAEYTTEDGWITNHDGYDIFPYFLGANEFDLQFNGGFINWGAYNASHTYTSNFMGTGSPVNFMIFDGDSTIPAINLGWYGDNSGNLTVKIYELP